MERKNLIILLSTIGATLTFIIVLTVILLATPAQLTYDEVLILAEQRMASTNHALIRYGVEYYSSFDDSYLIGNATFIKNDSFEQFNSLQGIVGIYAVNPSNLTQYMRLANNTLKTNAVLLSVKGNDCYYIRGFVLEGISNDEALDNYLSFEFAACFDKETGFPLQYIIISTENEPQGYAVSYTMTSGELS